MFDTRKIDLTKLNSMTKYPSIPTYHRIDGKSGCLYEESPISFSGCRVVATEKIDGCNGRIIFLPDGMWIIGSRESLLYAKGDLIGADDMGIVTTIKPILEKMHFGQKESEGDVLAGLATNSIVCLYVEAFGGQTPQAKQYSGRSTDGQRSRGVRLFDMIRIVNYDELFTWPIHEFSEWREAGHQPFMSESELQSRWYKSKLFPLAPRLFDSCRTHDTAGWPQPQTIEQTHSWLNNTFATHGGKTLAPLAEGGIGKPEGIVLRSHDRTIIAKVRFEDYERTMRKRNENKTNR